jgi:hypothetical protein
MPRQTTRLSAGAGLGQRRLKRLSDSWAPHNKPADFGRSPLPSAHPLPWSKVAFPKVLARPKCGRVDFRADRCPSAATLVQNGSPPLARPPVSACGARYPGGPAQAASPDRAALSNLRAGRHHNFFFEACSGFTHAKARRFAPPPKAPFVAGLRHGQLPDRAACQLPHQPTIARMDLHP